MTDPAANAMHSCSRELVKRVALRCAIAGGVAGVAVLAVTAAGPSWAGRVWSEATAAKMGFAQQFFSAESRHHRVATVPEDDYVAGLRRIGIVPAR